VEQVLEEQERGRVDREREGRGAGRQKGREVGSPLFLVGFLEIRSLKLFAWAGFVP
jgi:hypothetical protein